MFERCHSAAVVAGIAVAMLLSAVTASSATAEAVVFHAVSSGQQALDEGEGGGNPFASALIEILGRPGIALSELAGELARLTSEKSRGRMVADGPRIGEQQDASVVPGRSGEKRIAMVLVVSDYSRSGGAPSLPGARHDAQRIAAALSAAGYETETALDLDGAQIRARLAAFSARSKAADAALIYATGHGVEVGRRVYLLPDDFPVAGGRAALRSRAVAIDDIAGSLSARAVNVVFYGGCRDDPFED